MSTTYRTSSTIIVEAKHLIYRLLYEDIKGARLSIEELAQLDSGDHIRLRDGRTLEVEKISIRRIGPLRTSMDTDNSADEEAEFIDDREIDLERSIIVAVGAQGTSMRPTPYTLEDLFKLGAMEYKPMPSVAPADNPEKTPEHQHFYTLRKTDLDYLEAGDVLTDEAETVQFKINGFLKVDGKDFVEVDILKRGREVASGHQFTLGYLLKHKFGFYHSDPELIDVGQNSGKKAQQKAENLSVLRPITAVLPKLARAKKVADVVHVLQATEDSFDLSLFVEEEEKEILSLHKLLSKDSIDESTAKLTYEAFKLFSMEPESDDTFPEQEDEEEEDESVPNEEVEEFLNDEEEEEEEDEEEEDEEESVPDEEVEEFLNDEEEEEEEDDEEDEEEEDEEESVPDEEEEDEEESVPDEEVEEFLNDEEEEEDEEEDEEDEEEDEEDEEYDEESYASLLRKKSFNFGTSDTEKEAEEDAEEKLLNQATVIRAAVFKKAASSAKLQFNRTDALGVFVQTVVGSTNIADWAKKRMIKTIDDIRSRTGQTSEAKYTSLLSYLTNSQLKYEDVPSISGKRREKFQRGEDPIDALMRRLFKA